MQGLLSAPTSLLSGAAQGLLGSGGGLLGSGAGGGGSGAGMSNAAYQSAAGGERVSFQALNGAAGDDPLDADDLPLLRAVDSPVRASHSFSASASSLPSRSLYSATDTASGNPIGSNGSLPRGSGIGNGSVVTGGSIGDVLATLAAGGDSRGVLSHHRANASASAPMQQFSDANSVPVALLVPLDGVPSDEHST